MLASRRHVDPELLDSLLSEGPFTTRIRGDCMDPVLRDGVCVTLAPGAALWPGDLFVWRNGAGERVCHRYLGRFPGRRGLGYASWADRAERPDALITADRLIGRVTHVESAPCRVTPGQRARALARWVRFACHRVRHWMSR